MIQYGSNALSKFLTRLDRQISRKFTNFRQATNTTTFATRTVVVRQYGSDTCLSRMSKKTDIAIVTRCHCHYQLFTTSSNGNDVVVMEANIVSERLGSNRKTANHRHARIIQRQEEEEEALQKSLQEALNAYEELLLNQQPSTSKLELLESLEAVRDVFEQMTYWEQALEVEERMTEYLDDDATVAWAAHEYRKGKFAMRLGNPVLASKQYQKSLSQYEAAYGKTYHADIGNVLISMAGIAYHRDNLEAALDLLQTSESHFRYHGQQIQTIERQPSTGDESTHIDLSKCLQHQGLIYRSMEDFGEALRKYREGLDVLEKLDGDRTHTGKRLNLQMDIADVLFVLDQHDEALERYQEILDEDRAKQQSSFAQEEAGSALEGVILHKIGLIFTEVRDFPQAIEALTQAIQIKQTYVGDFHPEVGVSLNALGAVYAVTDRKEEAMDCFQQSLLISRAHANSEGKAAEDDSTVMHALRNIAILKGEISPQQETK